MRLVFVDGDSVLAFVKRLFLTIVYVFLGLWLAFPLSYFFQDELYAQIDWLEYLDGGLASIMIAYQFGSFEVYSRVALACAVGMVILGRLVELRLTRHRKHA